MRLLIHRILLVGLVAFASASAQKKVVFVDSYHEGYGWSDGITAGVKKGIDAAGHELKIIRMDTKRNPSEEFKKQAAEKAKAEIDAYKPDVIIAADDNANKYLIVPHYKNTETPVVFCGVNWDASDYGFPCKNITGMVEVATTPKLLEYLHKYSEGKRYGIIGPDNVTTHKEARYTEEFFGISFEEAYVSTMEEWKKAVKEMQSKVDIIYLDNNAGIEGWDDAEAEAFVLENVQIPTGVTYTWMMPVGLIGFIKSPEEQGLWAAGAANKILNGTEPSAIPVAKNTKGDLHLNMKLARKLGITFDLKLVKMAQNVIK